jgi:hypothetical protein
MRQKNAIPLFNAAILTLVATAAYGQDVLTAKVPFAFRAVGSDLPAGRYRVDRPTGTSGTTGTMELRNMDTGKAVFIISKAPVTESKNERPRLIFRCVGDEGCSLATLWSGTGAGLEFPTPALTAAQRERRETIYLDRYKDK